MNFAQHLQISRSNPHTIVLGVQGSGTNLVTRILKRVFGISIVRDRSLILESAARLSMNPSKREVDRQVAHVVRCLFPTSFQKRLMSRAYYHQGKKYRGIQEQLSSAEIGNAVQFAQFFYGYHAFLEQMDHTGMKCDDIWTHIDQVPRIIPNRRYVLLVRDPRDNAMSITRKPWGPSGMFLASRFVDQQLQIYRREIEQHPERSITVRYEELLTDPRQFIAQFSEHSGMAVCQNVEEQLEEIGIRAGNFEKWRKLSEGDLVAAESVLGKHIDELGYPASTVSPTPALSPVKAAGLATWDNLQRIPQKARRIWERRVEAR